MKRPCQAFALPEPGCTDLGCLPLAFGACLSGPMFPDSCQIAGGPVPGSRGAERSRATPQAPLTRGRARRGIMAGRAWAWCLPGPVAGGGAGGGGVPGRRGGSAVTATLVYACRDRRSGTGRMVPLTPEESRGCVHRSGGDRSCRGERPGTPPAWRARRRARRGPGRRGLSSGCQEVISAQTNPASSRATGADDSGGVFPAASRCLYLAFSRRCASRSGRWRPGRAPSWRRRSVAPMAGGEAVGPGGLGQAVRTRSRPGLGELAAPGS